MPKSSRQMDMLHSVVTETEEYLLDSHLLGYDPYDALLSPIFDLRILQVRGFRRVLQQFFRISPINLRPIFGIAKHLNPVTVALVAEGMMYKHLLNETETSRPHEIQGLITKLSDLATYGFSGAAWGYDFPWEAKIDSMEAYKPTAVATGIVSNSLYKIWKHTELESTEMLVSSSAEFILNDLNRTYDGEDYCISYSPGRSQQVLNAAMKGARLLTQAYGITGNSELLDEARHICAFVAKRQSRSGSWPYSVGDDRKWVDNFHTAYILDCFDEYQKISGDLSFNSVLNRGFEYYLSNLFTSEWQPKYYSNNLYPMDCTASAQAILTLLRFNMYSEALRVAKWAIDKMYMGSGKFKYRKGRFLSNNIVYIRWSVAWMYLALRAVEYEYHMIRESAGNQD